MVQFDQYLQQNSSEIITIISIVVMTRMPQPYKALIDNNLRRKRILTGRYANPKCC